LSVTVLKTSNPRLSKLRIEGRSVNDCSLRSNLTKMGYASSSSALLQQIAAPS